MKMHYWSLKSLKKLDKQVVDMQQKVAFPVSCVIATNALALS